jgi:hypothetical protein
MGLAELLSIPGGALALAADLLQLNAAASRHSPAGARVACHPQLLTAEDLCTN